MPGASRGRRRGGRQDRSGDERGQRRARRKPPPALGRLATIAHASGMDALSIAHSSRTCLIHCSTYLRIKCMFQFLIFSTPFLTFCSAFSVVPCPRIAARVARFGRRHSQDVCTRARRGTGGYSAAHVSERMNAVIRYRHILLASPSPAACS